MAQQNSIKIDILESQAMTSLGKGSTMVSGVPVIVLSPALEGAFFGSKFDARNILNWCASFARIVLTNRSRHNKIMMADLLSL